MSNVPTRRVPPIVCYSSGLPDCIHACISQVLFVRDFSRTIEPKEKYLHHYEENFLSFECAEYRYSIAEELASNIMTMVKEGKQPILQILIFNKGDSEITNYANRMLGVGYIEKWLFEFVIYTPETHIYLSDRITHSSRVPTSHRYSKMPEHRTNLRVVLRSLLGLRSPPLISDSIYYTIKALPNSSRNVVYDTYKFLTFKI